MSETDKTIELAGEVIRLTIENGTLKQRERIFKDGLMFASRKMYPKWNGMVFPSDPFGKALETAVTP